MSAGGREGHIPIVLVVAIAQNGVIGDDKAPGGMPWRLSTDMKRFKAITMGKPVIMGRKTYQAVGRPLPGRLNIVISRGGFAAEGVVVCASAVEALEAARRWARDHDAQEICVAGGGQIYDAFLPLASRLHVTHVMDEPEGDTRFPDFDEAEWTVVSTEPVAAGDKDSARTLYAVYERNAPVGG